MEELEKQISKQAQKNKDYDNERKICQIQNKNKLSAHPRNARKTWLTGLDMPFKTLLQIKSIGRSSSVENVRFFL